MGLGSPLIAAYLCVFLAGIFGAVFNPARIAIIPQLVEPERLASANSTVASTDRTMEILGALAAGFLVANIGVAAFYFDAATFAISALLLAGLRVAPPRNPSVPVVPSRRRCGGGPSVPPSPADPSG